MKTSSVLASMLFGSLAVAAPVMNKRDMVTKTETVVETIVVYTTVWDGETPAAAAATSTPGLFYEQHKSKSQAPASSQAQPTSAAYTPPAVQSSVYTPPVSSAAAQTPSPSPVAQPSSVYTPAPVEPSAAAAPSSVNTPSPVSSAAPAATSSTSSGGSGTTYSGDVTVYDNTGAAGACGESLTDDMMIVALAQSAWGASTYDVATGNPTNPWCGKQITIEMNGNQVQAKIMDMCPGCSGHDIDLSRAAFNQLTGTTGVSTRYHDVKWWVSS